MGFLLFPTRLHKLSAALFIIAFAGVGAYFLLMSRAAPMPVAPISKMALNWGQQNTLGDTSKYRYVLLSPGMYQSVAAIKAANPNTKVLVYKNIATTDNQCQYDARPSSGVSYCASLSSNPEWFLRDADGQTMKYCDFQNRYWMDIGNAAYQQKWLNNVKASLIADGFDGVYMDDVNTHPGHCKDNGGLLPKYTDVGYGQAMLAMMAVVGPGLKAAGFTVIGNVASDPWSSTQNSIALDMAPHMSVFFREHFMKYNNVTIPLFTGNEWLTTLQLMENTSQSSNFIGNTYSSATDTQAMLYGRASFLLGWNGNQDSAFQFHVDAQVDSYNPLWATDIGTPTAARFQVGTAWRRNYTGGTVVVNPSSTQSVTVALGATYTDIINGLPVTSVTLPPATAKILRGTTAPPPPPPPGATTLTFTPSADATIQNKTGATTNYGAIANVGVDKFDGIGNDINFLMKFDVSGIGTRTIASAKLTIYNVNPSPVGGNFYRTVSNRWQENTVTWNTAPVAEATLLASLGAVNANTAYQVDLKSLITGDGTFSLRASSTSTDGAAYASKEATTASQRPKLVITLN